MNSTQGDKASGTGASGGMTALGQLICDMNPYTEMPKWQMSGALKTGEMDVLVGASHTDAAGTARQMEVEVETGYPAQWAFKGQQQNVNTALRVKYRFPVLDKDGKEIYWVTEYLLVGYLGSGAG